MSPLIHGGRSLALARGKTLFDYADELAVRVPASCRRDGECHECIVQVRQGIEALSPATPAEDFLSGDYRLACQAAVEDPDALLSFAVLRRQPKILVEGVQRELQPAPLTARRGDEVLSYHRGPGDGEVMDTYRGAIFGIAVDAGTTTVVLSLVDLESSRTLHTASFESPQRFAGSNVMSRVAYDGGPYRGELTRVMHSAVNFEIGEMVRRFGIRRRQIYELVVVGNSTMRDLFFGLDVQPLGRTPFRSIVEHEFREGERETTAISAAAGDLGIRIHPRGVIYGGPLLGSHVGADVAADLLALGIDEEEDPVILVDVGTNSEIVIGTRDRLLAASCPAGPAFEGGGVKYGMPGYDGAIEAVVFRGGEVEDIRVIGRVAPQGICGSGLVDLIAGLLGSGRMSPLGAFRDGSKEFVVSRDGRITLSRADLSALAQARSANFCGQRIVLARYGLPLAAFSRLYLAGGFANYIDVENAVKIGFIPDLPADRVEKVGNTALAGATAMLLSGPLRRRIEDLARSVEHVELETDPEFFDLFVEGCRFETMSL